MDEIDDIRCDCFPKRYSSKCCCYFPTDNEHIANIITHGVPIPFAVFGLLLLCYKSENMTALLVSLVYGSSVVSLFTVSAIFHWKCYISPKRTHFQSLDRSVIYLTIASSYMPWLIFVKFPDNIWFTSVWNIYFIAALGILFELTWSRHYPIIGILMYISTGVIPTSVIIIQAHIPGKFGIIASGMTYVAGIYFFRCDGKILYAHAIWHVFVIVASLIHFVNVYMCFYSS